MCDEEWTETHTLDFKAQLPPSDDAGKDEFRKDICAFANADGGDIVYGISEKGGKAHAINSIQGRDFDGEKRRLLQILEAQVEPRIQGVKLQHYLLVDGGFVLLVRVPSSFDGPHRHGKTTGHRFVMRNNTLTSDMTYDHLRDAFGRRATLLERAAQFRAQRITKIMERKTPRLIRSGPLAVLHIVSMGGLAGRANVDVASLHKDHSILKIQDDEYWKRATNLDGLVMYPDDDPDGLEAYSQIFRNGAFEVAMHVGRESRQGHEKVSEVIGEIVADLIRDGLRAYARAATHLGVFGPSVISLSLLNTAGTILSTTRHFSSKVAEDQFDLPESWIEDINAPLDIDALTQPILDMAYQCYGMSKCDLFNDQGLRIRQR